ncbi:hypothetical protein WT27_06945 [Burkholderia territorii]|uniref:Uncharacterized protein n=1 Tax=Burkholderia territorii TaxID=1503055 RepID=A0A106E0N7_9BURK|nr:hypothetical protein WT27_06945 [Burkholderia territorii]KVX38726.1 hypothetical protein WT31_03180 [Burkholderia territorii]
MHVHMLDFRHTKLLHQRPCRAQDDRLDVRPRSYRNPIRLVSQLVQDAGRHLSTTRAFSQLKHRHIERDPGRPQQQAVHSDSNLCNGFSLKFTDWSRKWPAHYAHSRELGD